MGNSAFQGKKGGNSVISEFVGQQIREGQRGIVFGEDHGDVGIIRSLASEFAEMKKKGVSTLYIEYLPAEKQELLTKALNGHEKSQKELRGIFESGWGYSHEAAQERYNTIFEAHRQGMRVFAVDTPHSQGEISHDYTWDGANGVVKAAPSDERRFETSDAYIARQIKGHDDGKPFGVLYGRGHTYAPNAEGQFVAGENGTIRRSKLGGLDSRLIAEGIPVVSIDMESNKESNGLSIKRGNGVDNQFILSGMADDEKKLTKENMALSAVGKLSRLSTKLEHIVDSAQLPQDALSNAKIGAQMSRSIIDKVTSGKSLLSLDQEITNLISVISPITRNISNQNEALYLRSMTIGMRQILEDEDIRNEIKEGEAELAKPNSKEVWNPQAKANMGQLQGEWNKAIDPQTKDASPREASEDYVRRAGVGAPVI